MTIGQYLTQGAIYTAGFLLSCGPSQIFGIVKGGIDLVKLAILEVKIIAIGQETKNAVNLSDREISVIKLAKYQFSFDRQVCHLKIDGLALIPFVGAIASWEMYKTEKLTRVSIIGNGKPEDVEPIVPAREVEGFEKTIDDIEVDWRANEKYHHVIDQITKGVHSELVNKPLVASLKDELLLVKAQKPLDTSEKECTFYTAKALAALQSNKEFKNKRAAYKEYKENLRKALETDYYKNDPNSTPVAQLLNTLAYAEFAKVNVQAFTESVAKKFIKEESEKSQGHSIQNMVENLSLFHQSIKNISEPFSSIRGEIMFFGLDPLIQGNPATVKFKAENKQGKEITNVRTPTPTGKDGQVAPEFKAFLRQVKSRGEKYTMINLQNRTKPETVNSLLGFNGEYLRSKNLEALANDPEFINTFTCFTLDKNSPFFKQKTDGSESFKDFKSEFMSKLTDPKSGFFLPHLWHDRNRLAVIESKLDMVHETVFSGKDRLAAKERQDFIEIAYIFLADYFIKETEAAYYNESCKDCIDRGGGANWAMMAFLTILEIHDETRRHTKSPPIEQRIESLPAKFEEDAIWARKRPVVSERLERAEGAIASILNALETNPKNIERWGEEMNFKKIIMEPDLEQITKDSFL